MSTKEIDAALTALRAANAAQRESEARLQIARSAHNTAQRDTDIATLNLQEAERAMLEACKAGGVPVLRQEVSAGWAGQG